MTLEKGRKVEVLRAFWEKLSVKGWNFVESGEGEKDRELLVRFDLVIEEFSKLKER